MRARRRELHGGGWMNVPIDIRAFRTALESFATELTIVTTRGPKGEPVGNTISAASLDPPFVLWSLDKRAYSFKSLDRPFRGECLARGLGGRIAPLLTLLGRQMSGLPDSAQCAASSNADGLHLSGRDHVIFVGEVLNFDHDTASRPSLFWHGDYRLMTV